MRLRDGVVSARLEALVDRDHPARLDSSRLAAVLLPPSIVGIERTPYEGIVRAPPEPSSAARAQARAGDRSAAAARLVEQAPALLREALRLAVARAMEGARRVAIMAGGGVDSSLLLALALEVAKARGDVEVFAVALDFASPGDDRPHLAALASHLGLAPERVVRVAPSAAAPFVNAACFVADAAPCTWPSAPLERALAEAAKARGADRVLSGAGGDDLFDGDPTELASLLPRHPLAALARVRSMSVPWKASTLARARDFLVRPALSPLVPHAWRLARRRRTYADLFPWAGAVLRRAIEMSIADSSARPRAHGSPHDRYEQLARSPQLHEVATMRVQFEAASALRRVDPFLDPEVLAFVARLPPLTLLHGNQLRGLFRECARDLVPDSVRLRTDKAAFEPAQTEMVRAAGGFETLRSLASVTRAADLGLVEPAVFQPAFDALARDPEGGLAPGDWLGVWPILAVEAFLRSRESVD